MIGEHGDWIDAADLRVGDQLQNDDGTWSTVASIEIKSEEFTAYNLTVEDFNTYFVSEQGSQSAFWVHNTCLSVIKRDSVALAQLNKLSNSNNLGLSETDITDIIKQPFEKGQQWDYPKEVLNSLERASDASIPGLEISHLNFQLQLTVVPTLYRLFKEVSRGS